MKEARLSSHTGYQELFRQRYKTCITNVSHDTISLVAALNMRRICQSVYKRNRYILRLLDIGISMLTRIFRRSLFSIKLVGMAQHLPM